MASGASTANLPPPIWTAAAIFATFLEASQNSTSLQKGTGGSLQVSRPGPEPAIWRKWRKALSWPLSGFGRTHAHFRMLRMRFPKNRSKHRKIALIFCLIAVSPREPASGILPVAFGATKSGMQKSSASLENALIQGLTMHGGAKFPPPDLDDRSASAGFAVNRLNRMAVRRQDVAYLEALRRSGGDPHAGAVRRHACGQARGRRLRPLLHL